MKNVYLLFVLVAGSFLGASAQVTISGKITTDKGEALPYANISVKGSYDGGSSNDNGIYSFKTTQTGEVTVIATLIGYDKYEARITITDKPVTLNIRLKDKATELNTVVISAGSFEASDKKKAVILKPLDIVTTAGASGDIDGAIKTLPGAQTVGEQEGLFVRGGSASETKTIIDDMVVQNPYFSSVPDVPARGRFTPFLFSGTVFSTGGYSALYGQALSSTLVLNTEDLAEETRSALGITMVGFNAGHTHRWKNTSVSIDGSYTNLRPFYAINPVNSQVSRTWLKVPEIGTGSFILRQKTSGTGIFKIYGSFSASKLGLQFPNLNDSLKNYAKFTVQNTNLYINTSYRELLSKSWSVFTGASYSDNTDKVTFTEDFDRGNYKFNIDSRQQNTQGKFYLTRYFGTNSNLKFGGEVQNIIFGQDTSIAIPGFSGNLPNHNINELYTAGFAEVEIFITRKLAARIGDREEYSRILGKSNNAPRTALSYKTGDKSQVSVAYGKFYETPQRDELFVSNALTFEECTHYIANYQLMDDSRTFRIEAYYKQYNDLVRVVRSANTHLSDTNKVYTENNTGNGYARGIDIFWRDKKTIKNADYWISYTYLDTRRQYRYYPTLLEPSFATPHTVSVVFKQTIPKITTTIGLTYTFATGRPYYFFDPVNFNGAYISGKTPDYNNLSVNASYLTNIKGNFTVIFLGVNNILGINNIYGYRFSPDGRFRSPIVPFTIRTLFIGMFISLGSSTSPAK